ncbi:MAG: LysR family transcriptional regulator [Rhodoblastus sp.]|nr:MAG: LysR family transcriptional regulator [Rhodoblastus sp.]
MGVALFEGPRSRPTLTAAGRRLAEALGPALLRIEEAYREGGAREHEIAVRCFNGFALRWLIPRLPRYQARCPRDDVRLATREGADGRSASPVDVEIVALRREDAARAGDRLLFEEEMTVVVSPRVLARRPLRVCADLAALPEISARARPEAWRQWRALTGAPTPTPTRARTFEHYAFALEAAAAGQGACAAPRHLVIDDLEHGRLVEPFAPAATGLRYVARLRPNANAAARRFVAWIVREAKA